VSLSIEDRIKVEAQVESFIEIMAKRYGIKEEELPALVDDIRWIASHRRSIDRMAWSAVLGVIGLAVSGAGLMLWEGIKHTVTRGP